MIQIQKKVKSSRTMPKDSKKLNPSKELFITNCQITKTIFFQLHMSLGSYISWLSTSMFIVSLKINPEMKMRGLRKMLAVSTMNEILLFYLFSTASMELLFFFLVFLIEIFNNLFVLWALGIQEIYFFHELLCKIKNFKRTAGRLMHLSAILTEVGRTFAKLN